MTVFVNAIMYYKVKDCVSAVANVDDYGGSARLLAATTLRNILGTKTLGDILSDRESIAREMQTVLDEGTEPWGVYVERVEVKDVRVPEQLQRAMAAEAEAAREARAKVIAAEGEHQASRALRHAAEIISDCPAALQVPSDCIHTKYIIILIHGFICISIENFTLSAALPSNTEQYICRKQQYYSIPCTY